MGKRDLEFRVGIIILIGIIMLGGSLFWLRDYQLERNSRPAQIRFKDVGTLAVGDWVNVAGVRKGKVTGINLTENGVLVDIMIEKDVTLRTDTRFVIKNLGVMGERFIAVTMGQGEILPEPLAEFAGQYDTGLPEVMGMMGDMIVELRSLVGSFRQTVGSDSTLKTFNRTIVNLEEVSKSLASYLDRNQTKLDRTADNFLDASKQIKRILATNADHIDSTAVRADRLTSRLESFTGQLDTLALSFRQFADNLNNPEGTLQLLTEDRRLYDDLRQTADNIDDLITDIKANPRKYINLKVEIF